MTTEVKTARIGSSYHSEYQKASDRAGVTGDAGSGQNTDRGLADNASGMADDVAYKAKKAGDTVKDKAGEVGHDIAEKSRHAHHAICDFTKENPSVAVAMAFGLGAVIARVLPRW